MKEKVHSHIILYYGADKADICVPNAEAAGPYRGCKELNTHLL